MSRVLSSRPGALLRWIVPALLVSSALASPARAQDPGAKRDPGAKEGGAGDPKPAGDGAAKTAESEEERKPVVIDENVDVRGNRFKLKLKRGSIIHGVLPDGLQWEKRDVLGDYEPCKKGDAGAGLRVLYVLGMEGEVFIREVDIATIEDLGALTQEERERIRERVLADRRRVIEDRERALREELDRIRALTRKGAEVAAAEAAAEAEGAAAALTPEEAAGEALLKEFPPESWSAWRKSELLKAQVNGVYPTEEEAKFLRNFGPWEKALERRKRLEKEQIEKEAREAALKALGGDRPAEGTGEGEKKEGAGAKKEGEDAKKEGGAGGDKK